MLPVTVTANRSTVAVNITGATAVRAGVNSWVVTLTHDGATTTFPNNSFLVVAGVTPGTFNGTWLVLQSWPGAVVLSYRTTNPGVWTSGGTITTQTISPFVVMDMDLVPFNVGIGCIISGAPTYTVQHCFEDPSDLNFNPNWIDQPASGLSGETTNADGNYAFPVRCVRVNATAGTGSVAMTLLQGVRN
jgi:hypothetical protein